MRKLLDNQRGFTLIELIVAISILGVLAAIAVPSVLSFIGEGGEKAVSADTVKIQQQVDAFRADPHAGPDDDNKWGTEPEKLLYPTEDGEVGALELNFDETDSDYEDRDNFRIDKHKAGPGTNGAAGSSQIEDSLLWLGLLVNEPFDSTGSEQDEPGNAHPQGSERGEYLFEFPNSAHPDNSSNLSDGSYTWVIMDNGQVVPVYEGSDGDYYTGYNDVYP